MAPVVTGRFGQRRSERFKNDPADSLLVQANCYRRGTWSEVLLRDKQSVVEV